MLVWSGEKSHCTLAFKVRWCNHTGFFRRTAKNLVAYAASWSLTLSPDIHFIYFRILQSSLKAHSSSNKKTFRSEQNIF